jgi:hypothetical protein
MAEKTTIIYYTDNILDNTELGSFCRKKLIEAADGKRIISVSQKAIDFGDNISVGEIGRSHHSLFLQTLIGAKEAKTKYIALAEHDCLYTSEHFNWTPPDERFYYNVNHWFVQWESGEYSYQRRKVMSNLICERNIFIRAIEEKIKMIELGAKIRKGQIGACEPGVCDNRQAFIDLKEEYFLQQCRDNPNYKDVGKETFSAVAFRTELPNLDIRHGNNFSGRRRAAERTYVLPYWGKFKNIIN